MMARAENHRGTLIAVAAIIASGVVAGIVLGRGGDTPAVTTAKPAAATVPASATPTMASPVAPAAAPAESATEDLSAVELARLAEESMAGAATTRAAAIERLSQAPREQALPLLRRVLLNGDPVTDRPAALRALQSLALAQGDGDQRIRDVVREVIYHGDDETLATDAQETLDVIAESEAK